MQCPTKDKSIKKNLLRIFALIKFGCNRYHFNTNQYNSTSYLVLNEEGSPDTTWWNNNGSVPGYIDFTNPEAADWFSDRVRNVIETYDIDTVKFDAGESSWSPQVQIVYDDGDGDEALSYFFIIALKCFEQINKLI